MLGILLTLWTHQTSFCPRAFLPFFFYPSAECFSLKAPQRQCPHLLQASAQMAPCIDAFLETIPFKISASPARCLKVLKLCLTLWFYIEFTAIWPNVCVSSPIEVVWRQVFWLGHCCICSPWNRPNNTMQVLSYAYGVGILLALQNTNPPFKIRNNPYFSFDPFLPPLSEQKTLHNHISLSHNCIILSHKNAMS